MDFMYNINTFLFAVLGLLIGSFLNVFVYRVPRGMTIVADRSKCTNCESEIKPYDLIPVLSYFLLGGKCRHCKTKISIMYPLVEILTSISFAGTYIIAKKAGVNILLILFLLFIVSLVIIGCFTDFKYLGCYDLSTKLVCILYVIFILIATRSLKSTILVILAGAVYLIPMILMSIYAYAIYKGKIIYRILAFLAMLAIAMLAVTKVNFDFLPMFAIINSLINWFILFIPLIIADYLINKLKINDKFKKYFTTFTQWFGFVTYFMFLFANNYEILTLDIYKSTLSFSFKNIAIIIICSIGYIFFIELFNGYDNDTDLIDEDEEIQDREENKISNYIGDGDFLIIPIAGMILGSANIISFYSLLGFNVLAIYCIIFKKGAKYHIPMYPYIIFSIVVLYFKLFTF